VCGDGACQPECGENANTCQPDCLAWCVCGNYLCETWCGESAYGCPHDCGFGPGSESPLPTFTPFRAASGQ
jgi:hypothetical protein